jgi:hypothetical protein
MPDASVRSTLYLHPDLHKALRLKSAETHRSVSDLVNEAVREAFREDEEDIAALAERKQEKPISYEAFLAKLKADGTI